MNITILSVQITTVSTKTGSYQMADIAYKNNSFQGKVEGKKMASFGAQAESFKAVAQAQPGETFEVEVKKNDKNYNDWVKMTKAGVNNAPEAVPVPGYAPNPVGGKSNATTAPRSTYETPEERAIKQVYIVRQSSVSNAIATLLVGAKKLDPVDVLALAKRYEGYVFGKADPGASGFDDVPAFDKAFDNQPQVD